MQKLYQSCYVSHNETLKPDKRFCYDFVIGMFFTWPHFLVLQQLTTLYLVPRYLIEVPHQCIYSYYPPPFIKRYKSGLVPFTRASANGAHRAPRSRVTRLTTDKMSTFFAVVDGAQSAVAALT